MVMKIEPIERCINALKAERDYDEVIFTTPDGEQFNQPMANSLSLAQNLIILCGHFKGIDYRIREHLVTREISIGDYVLTGGELAACIIADSVIRIIPEPSGTKPRRSRTASRTTCWHHRFTPDPPSSTAGKCPTCSSRAISPESTAGRRSRPGSAPNGCGPIY